MLWLRCRKIGRLTVSCIGFWWLQRALKFGTKVRLLRGKVCRKMRQNAANESLPFRGPRKIFDFWGGFWEI